MTAKRRSQSLRLRDRTEFGSAHPGVYLRSAASWVNGDLLHARQVDDHAVANRSAKHVEPARSHCHFQRAIAGEPDRANDVRLIRAACDQLRMAVGRGIETRDPACRIVRRITRTDDLAS